ncbi:hypothetical protein L9F63_019931, partial [Diploptera punctata]
KYRAQERKCVLDLERHMRETTKITTNRIWSIKCEMNKWGKVSGHKVDNDRT